MDYPHIVREALQRVEQILLANSKPDFSLDIIAESIFLDKKNLHAQRSMSQKHALTLAQHNTLTLTQEFQLVIALCDFYIERQPTATTTKTDAIAAAITAAGNALFMSLFSTGTASVTRPRVLAKLISTAISGAVPSVLEAAGIWLQQTGPTSSGCVELARQLVDDFVNYSSPDQSRVRLLQLASLAPRFTVNLMTAITELYLLVDATTTATSATNCQTPPPVLLEILTGWLHAAPTLCAGVQLPPALPAGAIAMPLITPLAGLIRWCVLAPMCSHPAAGDDVAPAASAVADSDAYSRLHLAILQSLSHGNSPAAAASTLSAISAAHLCVIVSAMRQMPSASEDDERMQASLERFAQSVQLALAARQVTGNVSQLMCRMETLPRNALLQIVIRANKATM